VQIISLSSCSLLFKFLRSLHEEALALQLSIAMATFNLLLVQVMLRLETCLRATC